MNTSILGTKTAALASTKIAVELVNRTPCSQIKVYLDVYSTNVCTLSVVLMEIQRVAESIKATFLKYRYDASDTCNLSKLEQI